MKLNLSLSAPEISGLVVHIVAPEKADIIARISVNVLLLSRIK